MLRSVASGTRRLFQLSNHFGISAYRSSSATTTSATKKMAPVTSWDRLVRYISAKDGKIRYGEPIVSDSKPNIDQLAQDGKLEVKVLEGPNIFQAQETGEQDQVKQLLGPLTPGDVPIIRCIGLNYKTHSTFGNFLSHKISFFSSYLRTSPKKGNGNELFSFSPFRRCLPIVGDALLWGKARQRNDAI